jgi:hypothetical protein
MNLKDRLIDFIKFKELVAPAFLKLLYAIFFVLLNLAWLLGLAAFTFGGLGAAANTFSKDIVGGIVAMLVLMVSDAILLVAVVVSNLFLRMYFELILVIFNMHGFLKSIDEKLGRRKK